MDKTISKRLNDLESKEQRRTHFVAQWPDGTITGNVDTLEEADVIFEVNYEGKD